MQVQSYHGANGTTAEMRDWERQSPGNTSGPPDPAIPADSFTDELFTKTVIADFPGGAVDRNPPANAGDMGSIPGPGRSHMP